MNKDDYYLMNKEQLMSHFDTSINGLTNEEVSKRLTRDGKNVLPKEKKDTAIKIFLKQLNNPIVIILFVAIILSIISHEVIDAIFIMIVILLDATLGTYQEVKAEKSAESLQNLIKTKTMVRRNNREELVDSADLVIGDIVVLDSGDNIAADMIIIDAHNLTANEAVLTGESIAAVKSDKVMTKKTANLERSNTLYAGTSIVRGRATAIVINIGLNTEIGNIAGKVLNKPKSKSPLVTRMEKFTTQIGITVVIIGIILAILLWFKDYPLSEIFFSVVALCVSAIPEGLPVALTLALSIASGRMAKRNMLVKKLNAVESLGSCTVIASDKTGTLTVNEQTAKILVINNETIEVTGTGYNDEGKIITNSNNLDLVNRLAILGAINNEAKLEKTNNKWTNLGDSIDVAFLSLFEKSKAKKDHLVVKNIIPYESEEKFSAVFFEEDNQIKSTTKGSLERVISFCNDSEKIKKYYLKKEQELAKDGYRVIAITEGITNIKQVNDLEISNHYLVGLVGFIDPIRKETVAAIKACHDASIKTLMITGDHPLTAFHIAKQLNMASKEEEVTTGEEINEYLKQGYNAFDQFIKNKKVFARVSPDDKYEIVESYKRQNEYIAVTGDGVNDAPALKNASIGIAMGSGTDVAKETGEMIITDDNFLSIVAAVEEGRVAYDNVRKVIYMVLSTGIAEVLFFMLSIIFGLPIPLIAIQLLWLNLVTDGVQDAALAFEKKEPDVMSKPPRNPKEKIFDPLLLKEVLLSGLSTGIIVFIYWIYLLNNGYDLILARSYIVILMVFMQNMHVLNCRSETRSIFKIPFSSNPFVIFAIIFILILQFVVIETPVLSGLLSLTTVPFWEVIKTFVLALPILVIIEMFKLLRRKGLIK